MTHIPLEIPDEFYNRHELLLSRLATKCECDIDELIPVVNLMRSNFENSLPEGRL